MNSEEILKDLELVTKRCSDYIINAEKISKKNEELTKTLEIQQTKIDEQQSDIEYLKTDLLIKLSENEESKKNIVEKEKEKDIESEI